MIRQFILLVSALIIISCSVTKSGDKICYKGSRTTLSIQWTEKIIILNYLKLKKGNYFQYYQRFPTVLPGIYSAKLVEYQGSYVQQGDTIIFHFCGDTIPRPMTEKILIDTAKKQIVFLSVNPRLNQHFDITLKK